MTLDQNKRLVQGIWQAILDEDWRAMGHAYHPHAVYHGPGGTEVRGREGIVELTKRYRAAFPDMGFEILHCVAEGDMVATRGLGTGTHRGELMGISPTDKSVRLEIMYFMHVVDSQVVEEWEVFDQMDLRKQLGVLHA